MLKRGHKQLIAYVVLVAAVLAGFAGTAAVRHEDCTRANHNTSVLRTIITRSDQSLGQLHDKHQISDALYANAKKQNADALNDLKPGTCSFLLG